MCLKQHANWQLISWDGRWTIDDGPERRYGLLSMVHRRSLSIVKLFWGRCMSTEVVMPQMGESIAEGTITKWLKKIGERVERDEPLFEITTDKVDAEIPSPAAGVLQEIKVGEGQTLSIRTVEAA